MRMLNQRVMTTQKTTTNRRNTTGKTILAMNILLASALSSLAVSPSSCNCKQQISSDIESLSITSEECYESISVGAQLGLTLVERHFCPKMYV